MLFQKPLPKPHLNSLSENPDHRRKFLEIWLEGEQNSPTEKG
jgi:hypothetical protein